MSGVTVPPTKFSLRQRCLKYFGSRRRTSSPPPSPASPTYASTSSTIQSPGSSSTQILTSSSHPSAGTVTANLSNASAAFLSSQQATSHPPTRRDLLHYALQQLSDRDRATLGDHILPTSSDINLAVEQALTAAKEQQRCCVEKRWTFTFAGRTITLKEEADKVVHWLNRFKSVGDVAVNADSIHAGLPWAGIRLLLEVRAGSHNLEPIDCLLTNR
jgi:hypothetical protein